MNGRLALRASRAALTGVYAPSSFLPRPFKAGTAEPGSLAPRNVQFVLPRRKVRVDSYIDEYAPSHV